MSVVLATVAMLACASEDSATPSLGADAQREPTPTPEISSSNGTTRVVVHLSSVKGEGQVGSATLVSDGVTTTVEIEVGPIFGAAQPIHIHTGKCEDVGGVVDALQNVVNGKSMTTIDRPLGEILTGDTLVNVHASYADLSNFTACGQLPSELP